MCGIAGELGFRGAMASPEGVARSTRALAHRGPDDDGHFHDGVVALGFRRLSIIDLSPNGHQPMWTADGSLAIVFNGEMYNFAEVQHELQARGYVFRSASDTEVLLNAIHCWGIEDALKRAIGMFAFAVWNARDRSLLLCRDRAGIKPLYYYAGAEQLLFASEMKGLLAHPAFRRELDPDSLAQYFILGYCAGERTVFRNTFKVPAGHFARIAGDGTITRHRYWSLASVERGSYRGTFEQACDELSGLCESAFGYRLVSDVPVGVFLSGGIDSTLVAAVLKKRLHADLLHLTVGFRQSAFDEAPKAAAVARHLGVRHVVEYLDAPDAVAALRQFVEIYDEPFADTSGIPTALVSTIARRHVTVALSGDGGDEQFCGYDSYHSHARRFERLRPIPRPLRHAAASLLGRLVPYELLLSATLASIAGDRARPQTIARYEKALDLLRVDTSADLLALMNEKAWARSDVGPMLRGTLQTALDDGVLGVSNLTAEPDSLLDAMMRMDYGMYMKDDILAKVDRASMAVSLECRDPLLDHRIAEFAFSLPLEYVCGAREQKRILKRLLRPWVSDEIVNAPKWGFSVPLYAWMRGPWKPLVETYLSPERVRAVGVLDERRVTAEVDRFYRYNGCSAEKIFTMLNFQMWAERWYLPQPAQA